MAQGNESERRTNIRPGMGILTYLQHIEYKPWYAIAEYIDNSIESYHKNIKLLPDGLEVHIEITDGGETLTIYDNAAGIFDKDIDRALVPAKPPPSGSKLSEFGMGMKTASYWFSNKWKIETTAIGEPTRKECAFDIEKLKEDETGDVVIKIFNEEKHAHWTKITLSELNHKLSNGVRVKKIKSHLANTYKELIGEKIKIFFDGEMLSYQEPEVLEEPVWPKPERASIREGSPIIKWLKEFEFDVNGKNVRGKAFLTKKGSNKTSGLTMYRRGRAIAGTSEEKLQPDDVYKGRNSHRRLRLCIEVHMDEFKVPTTKAGVIYEGDDEEVFMDSLKNALRDKNNYLKQADNYRALDVETGEKGKPLEEAVGGSIDELSEPITRAVIEDRDPLPNEDEKACFESSQIRDIRITDKFGDQWKINWSISKDPLPKDTFTVKRQSPTSNEINVIIYTHSSFVEKHVRFEDESFYKAPMILIAAMAAAEIITKILGESDAQLIREHTNYILNQDCVIEQSK